MRKIKAESESALIFDPFLPEEDGGHLQELRRCSEEAQTTSNHADERRRRTGPVSGRRWDGPPLGLDNWI